MRCDFYVRKFKYFNTLIFDRRQRAVQDGSSKFLLNLGSGKAYSSYATFDATNQQNGHKFTVEVHAYEGGIFRVKMNEASPLLPRYEVEHALLPELKQGS